MSGGTQPSVCIVFVCQAGELELKGALLAASLRRAGVGDGVELTAAVPDESVWGPLSGATRSLLDALGARVEPIESPFGADYPIGNKIAALGVPTRAPVTAFLDSDILCLRPLDAGALATRGLLAKPADFRTFGGDGDEWPAVYRLFGVEPPAARVVSTLGNEEMPPYFNAGVVAARDGAAFSRCWLETARTIDGDVRIANKRPWLDQVALPVAAALLGYELESLTEDLNYPVHERCLDERHAPTLCHYHWPEVVEQEAGLSKLVDDLSREHPALRDLMGRYPKWSGVAGRARRFPSAAAGNGARAPVERRDFLVTGIPWSGSSVLSGMLHAAPETALVNDPDEIRWALSGRDFARRLGLVYRSLRTGVVLDRGVESRLDERHGFTEDLFGAPGVMPAPPVSDEAFPLGTRNSMAYLARLRALCVELPALRKIATIRHPLQTIEYWKRLPPAAEGAYIDLLDFGDGLVDDFQRQAVARIRAEGSAAARRALLWRYLAELVWRDREHVLPVRFEDLADDPEAALARVARFIGAAPGRVDAAALAAWRGVETSMDAAERRLTLTLCAETMAKWGYS